jgi:hypothetical protein
MLCIVKKVSDFPVPAKLSPAGDGKIANIFLQCDDT